MAGFVDCTKYNKEQQEQDTRIDNLEKREIVHDETCLLYTSPSPRDS